MVIWLRNKYVDYLRGFVNITENLSKEKYNLPDRLREN